MLADLGLAPHSELWLSEQIPGKTCSMHSFGLPFPLTIVSASNPRLGSGNSQLGESHHHLDSN